MPVILRRLDGVPVIGEPVTVDVHRFDPSRDSEPRLQRYVVPYRHRMNVFSLLWEIYEHQDPTLAFRTQHCGIGVCGTCVLRVEPENKIIRGCKTPVRPGDHLVIKPYNEKNVIRDLVVDL